MGGKSQLLDPAVLEDLYIESINYKKNVDNISHTLRTHMNKLTDPIFLNGFKHGKNDMFVNTILGAKQAMEELLSTVKESANHIDSTLENTKLPWDTQHQTEKIKESQINKTLKR